MTDDLTMERSRLMAEGNELRARAYELRYADRTEEAFPLWDRIEDINKRYRAMLPEVPVARCPDSGELVTWPIDTYGLDAWFWEYDATIRRSPRPVPPTWLAMAGAMRLENPLEDTPFTVFPGPGVPFVVPRILNSPGVRAVISEVAIGRHTGWTISYFGPRPDNVPLVNLWGTNTYPVYRPGQPRGWAIAEPRTAEYDFDLTDWLRSGALLWIEPGDSAATPREGLAGCPFRDLTGERLLSVCAHGSVKWIASLDE